ncbi:MAG: hypothetical protein V2A58_13595 [Planctomycetota bacterium]
MPPSKKIRAGARDWYVLLRWLQAENKFEGFMLSGRQARLEVRKSERFQNKRIAGGMRKNTFPSLYVGPKVEDRAKLWRRRWLSWKL